MKKIVAIIVVVFGLMGVVTGTAQEAATAPTRASDKMQRAWLWREGTKFTGTTLVFTSDKKIEIKPSKEKLHIYSKKYDSNWVNSSGFFGFMSNASAHIYTAIHAIPPGPAPEDYSGVHFKFEDLKVDGSEMTGTCTYSISYGFKGDTQVKKLKEDKVPVKFTADNFFRDPSTNVSNQPNPNNVGQPGNPKIPKDFLTEPERFDQEVLKEINELFEKNPGMSDLDLQQKAEKFRIKEGESPKWVAVEHYFFGRVNSYLVLNGIAPRTASAAAAFLLPWGYEHYSATIGWGLYNAGRAIGGRPRPPGPRGFFTQNIADWGNLGLLGWRP